MQDNEPTFVEQSSPGAYSLFPEDQFLSNEVVAGDTWCLDPGIRPSSSLCSHDQSISAIDPSTYQPSALYQYTDNPWFDPSVSVPGFDSILALHDNDRYDHQLALTASVNDHVHDGLPTYILPEVAVIQPELEQTRPQSLPPLLLHRYASPLEYQAGDSGNWNHDPEELSLPNFCSTAVFSHERGWLQQSETGLPPVFYQQDISQSGVDSRHEDRIEAMHARPSYISSSQHEEEGASLFYPNLVQPGTDWTPTQHQPATRNAAIAKAFTEGSYHPNPALRALLEYIQYADFVLHHAHEPVVADDYSICALAHISAFPKCPSIGFESLNHSLFSIFVNRPNYRCLFCGSCKSSLARALGCVRVHLGHRPFNCTGCQSCDVVNGYARFSTAALLRDHLNGQEKKIECVRCHTKLRRGGMKRHWKSMHKEENFPFHDYPRYRQGGVTPTQSTPSVCLSPPGIDEAQAELCEM